MVTSTVPEALERNIPRRKLFLARSHATLINFYRQTLSEVHQKLSKAFVGTVEGELWFEKNSHWSSCEKRRRGWEEQTESWHPTAALKLKSISVWLSAWLSQLYAQSLIQSQWFTHSCTRAHHKINSQRPTCHIYLNTVMLTDVLTRVHKTVINGNI